MKEEALAEAERLQSAARQSLDSNKLREKLDASNFSPNAVIRGAQLTLVGAHRALQNPALFTNDHYKQAAIAVVVGIGIRLAIIVPVGGLEQEHFPERQLMADAATRFLAFGFYFGHYHG